MVESKTVEAVVAFLGLWLPLKTSCGASSILAGGFFQALKGDKISSQIVIFINTPFIPFLEPECAKACESRVTET